MKMKQKTLFILFAFILSFVGQSYAQRGSIKASVEPKEILIGQQATISLEVKTKEGELVLFPVFPDTIVSGLEVLPIEQTVDTLTNDGWTLSKKYVVTAFDSTRYHIPFIPVIVGIDTLKSDSLELFVTIPQLSEATLDYANKYKKGEIDSLNFAELEIADIKPISSPPFVLTDYIEYVAYPFIFIVIIALIALAYIFYQRKKKKGYYFKPAIILPPDVVALNALNSLRTKNMIQKGLIKEYHTELTDILRQYLQAQFDIDAPEMLTSEIINKLQEKAYDNTRIMEMRDILELADLVKFARLDPLTHENDGSLTKAFSFVENTKPIEVPTTTTTENVNQQNILKVEQQKNKEK